MTFTQIPQQYAPLGAEAIYAVENPAGGDLDIRIADERGATLGALRFAAAATARFDAAPALRRALRFIPLVGNTGFYAATGRVVKAAVTAGAAGTLPEGTEATAPARTFLPGREAAEAPALLTTLPRRRIIPEGACEEADPADRRRRRSSGDGPDGRFADGGELLRPDVGTAAVPHRHARLPGAETLSIDFGEIGTVEYTVVPAVREAVRLAWRSSAGSVEHYRLPGRAGGDEKHQKRRACGPEGHVVVPQRSERRTALASAYETPEMLEALAELTETPEVWIAGGGDLHARRRPDRRGDGAPPRHDELPGDRNPRQTNRSRTMELTIDGRPCDLGPERIAVPGYDARKTATPESLPRRPHAPDRTSRDTPQRRGDGTPVRAPRRREVQRHAPRSRADGRRGRAAARTGTAARRDGRGIHARNPQRRRGMGRERRTTHVQHAGGRIRRRAHADRHPRRMDRRPAREVLPRAPRRVPRTERPVRPAARRTGALAGRLPPLPARGHACRTHLRGGRLPRREPLLRLGVLPLALHERSLPLARHRRSRSPHGLLGPPDRPRHGEGQRGGEGRRRPATALNSVGNIVETATPQSTDADGNPIDGLYNHGGCFSTDGGRILFTPLAETTAGFEYRLRYTTSHRILSRTRLRGFDTVYLGPGSEMAFTLANRYEDHRAAPEANRTYRALVFDHREGARYRLRYTRDGVEGVVWTEFAARSAQVTTPASGRFADPVLEVRNSLGWEPFEGDWALYAGYVGETGETTVELRLRTASEELGPSKPKRFDQIYFAGAEGGHDAHAARGVRPAARFRSGPGFGSAVRFADVAQHRIRQAELLGAPRTPVQPAVLHRGGDEKGLDRTGRRLFSAQVPRRTGAAGPTSRSRWSGGMRRRRCTRRGAGATAKGTAR